jgi:DnaJ-domain-containing protein 1
MTSETAWLQAEVVRLRRALAEERWKRQASEQAVTLARQQVVGELRSTALGVLGLLPGADLEVAEAAYRTLVRRHHPDRGGNEVGHPLA